MTNPQNKAKLVRRAAQAACVGMLLSSSALAAWGRGAQHGAPAPHFSAPRPAPQSGPRGGQAPRPQGKPQQGRPQPSPQSGGQQPMRPPAGYPSGPGGQQRGFGGNGAMPARPAYNGIPNSVRPAQQPAGHLPDWMAQHRNLAPGDQERLLRQEPGFNRLSAGTQQREIDELHRLNSMPEAERQRRMARNEALERMSPEQRLQVNQAGRRMAALPADRQVMVRRAFQDLRGVPVDQRETILNSARYNATFSPDERGILSNLLKAEPYEPVR